MSELLTVVFIAVALLSGQGDCDSNVSEQVEIVRVGDVQQEDVELVISVLDSLPQRHLLWADCSCALRQVVLVEGENLENLPPDAAVYKRNPDYDGSQALGLAEDGVVYVAVGSDIHAVLVHEVGHIVLDGEGRYKLNNAIVRGKLTELYQSGDASMGPYSRKNDLEFRAEAYEHCAVGGPMSADVVEVMGLLFGNNGCIH